MSRFWPHGGRGSSRLAIVGAATAFVAVVAGFAWVSIQSYNFIHQGSLGASNLKPVRIIGPEQRVFIWRRQACEPRDLPDAPARAFRDANGQVHLIASSYINRQAVGPTLDSVKHRCDVSMTSAYDPNPAKFEDHEWLAAPYTPDGKTVFALIHNEYQGNTHLGRCPTGDYFHCWYNAVTLARSDDMGTTFHHARPAPGHLVAEIPYRYQPDGGVFGVFQPSNIVKRNGYYYAMVATIPHRQQRGGACLMRTQDLANPASWRAWDGGGYNASFVDPYKAQVAAGNHVCAPVSPDQITDMTFSLTYNTYFGKYLLVSRSSAYDASQRRTVWGFYYSLSDNLVDWSTRKLLKEAVLPNTYQCGGPDPLFYPSILDPTSKSRNFETSGRRPYLYFTRLHSDGCQLGDNRDLVRVPIEFSK